MTPEPLYQALVVPDDRGRFPLRRYLPKPDPRAYKLFISDDGLTITLQAVPE